MRLIFMIVLLLSACTPLGPSSAEIQQISSGRGGIDHKGDGYGSSLTFRRDGTAEDESYKLEHDVRKDVVLKEATVTPEQFDRLAATVVANHFFSKDPYKGSHNDSFGGITVILPNGETRHAAITSNDPELKAISTALSDLAKQMEWQEVQVKTN